MYIETGWLLLSLIILIFLSISFIANNIVIIKQKEKINELETDNRGLRVTVGRLAKKLADEGYISDYTHWFFSFSDIEDTTDFNT